MKANGPKRLALRLAPIVASVILLSTLIVGTGSTAQTEFVQILSIDDYSKEVTAGSNATYNWTIMNADSGANLTVIVTASISGRGWTCEVDEAPITLPPDGFDTVNVTVTAPLESGSQEANLTVTLNVYEGAHLVQVSSVGADTIIVGAFASANKVLGYFDNPLPSPLDNEWGVFLLDVIIWLAIAFSAAYIMDGVAWAFTRKTASMLDDIILGILRTPVLLLVFLYGVVNSMDALHMHIPVDLRDTVMAIYGVIVVLVVFYLAYKLFKKIIVYYGKIVAKKTASKVDDVLIPVIEKLGVVVIDFAALGYAL
ncbi:MAG TPA: hypothetical protein VMW71_03440, partial [Thermoplasmata archaeon]|nr:hypothetical protein [Thermoplasmata archaeon]